jgi:hypothetical protein
MAYSCKSILAIDSTCNHFPALSTRCNVQPCRYASRGVRRPSALVACGSAPARSTNFASQWQGHQPLTMSTTAPVGKSICSSKEQGETERELLGVTWDCFLQFHQLYNKNLKWNSAARLHGGRNRHEMWRI